MSRSSPPPYPVKATARTASRTVLPRRSRYLYLVLALLIGYLWFTGYSPASLLPHRPPQHAPSIRHKNIDWSRYAYFQYATSTAYLCNAIMLFEALDRLGSKADRVLLYPDQWDTRIESLTDRDSQLLVKARDWYKVKLVPVDIPITYDRGQDEEEWDATFTKFMAWGQSDYERVLHLDSDITVLKHVDELFLLPRSPVSMMRAHWNLPDKKLLSPRLILLQPSGDEFERFMTATRSGLRQAGDSDMEILNRYYSDSAMVLPHQAYGLLSNEFRLEDHKNFIGNSFEPWDPEKAFKEASLVHFLDEPFPKPWVMWPHNLYAEKHPPCKAEDCRNKNIWESLYDDFRRRRKDICALLSAPAPEWPPRNQSNRLPAG